MKKKLIRVIPQNTQHLKVSSDIYLFTLRFKVINSTLFCMTVEPIPPNLWTFSKAAFFQSPGGSSKFLVMSTSFSLSCMVCFGTLPSPAVSWVPVGAFGLPLYIFTIHTYWKSLTSCACYRAWNAYPVFSRLQLTCHFPYWYTLAPVVLTPRIASQNNSTSISTIPFYYKRPVRFLAQPNDREAT